MAINIMRLMTILKMPFLSIPSTQDFLIVTNIISINTEGVKDAHISANGVHQAIFTYSFNQ